MEGKHISGQYRCPERPEHCLVKPRVNHSLNSYRSYKHTLSRRDGLVVSVLVSKAKSAIGSGHNSRSSQTLYYTLAYHSPCFVKPQLQARDKRSVSSLHAHPNVTIACLITLLISLTPVTLPFSLSVYCAKCFTCHM